MMINNINHPICLCKNMLKEHNSESWTGFCANCARQISDIGQSMYACVATDCIYKNMVHANYIICQECYNETTSDDSNDSDNVEFVCSKLLSSINTISYVLFIYLKYTNFHIFML